MSTRKLGRPDRATTTKRSHQLSDAELDGLIDEATVDAHDESEQACGFFAVLEDELVLPFETTILDAKVTVEAIDLRDDDRIFARCVRGRSHQDLALEDLPLRAPPPAGARWIAAYRRWVGRR